MDTLIVYSMPDVVVDDLELPGQLHVLVPGPHSVTHFPGFQEQSKAMHPGRGGLHLRRPIVRLRVCCDIRPPSETVILY